MSSLPVYTTTGIIKGGSFSGMIIYKIRDITNGIDFALKAVNVHDPRKIGLCDHYSKEYKLQMHCSSSEHIVGCYDYFCRDIYLYARLELCDYSLKDQIHELGIFRMPLAVLLSTMLGVAKGLKYMHDMQLIHRDINPANILLKNGIAKIGDFDLVYQLKGTVLLPDEVVGTPGYLAPEICKRKKYSYGVDVWGLGVVLYQLLALRLPFLPLNQSIELTIANDFPILYKNDFKGLGRDKIYGELTCLTNECMQQLPEYRPTASMCVVKLEQYLEVFKDLKPSKS